MIRYRDWSENEQKSSQCPKKSLIGLQKAGERLLKTTLRITRKSGYFEAKFKEMRSCSRLLHTSVCLLVSTLPVYL